MTQCVFFGSLLKLVYSPLFVDVVGPRTKSEWIFSPRVGIKILMGWAECGTCKVHDIIEEKVGVFFSFSGIKRRAAANGYTPLKYLSKYLHFVKNVPIKFFLFASCFACWADYDTWKKFEYFFSLQKKFIECNERSRNIARLYAINARNYDEKTAYRKSSSKERKL